MSSRMTLARLALYVLFAALFVGQAGAQQVTVMTYNVENMFDVFDDPYSDDDGTDVKRRDEIAAIAKSIAKISPDIVVFQELENEHLLQGMVDTFLLDSGYEYITAQRTNSSRGINLGIISRYPIKRLASYRFQELTHPDAPDETWRFARDVMQITLDIKGQDLQIFNVHLKSNGSRPGDPNSKKWRTAEAIALKGMIRELYTRQEPGSLILAMGDFNSNLETRPEQDRPWPATEFLRKPEPGGMQLLNDAHDGTDYDKRVTIMGDNRYPPAVFDYIYATPSLHQKLVKGSAGVLYDKAITGGSDHMPVYATYDFSK